jgi:hypothetical protein
LPNSQKSLLIFDANIAVLISGSPALCRRALVIIIMGTEHSDPDLLPVLRKRCLSKSGTRSPTIDPKIRAAIFDAEIGFLMDARPETIKGDDYPIEYDSDGYPELPAGLD